jgi:hypothetical protein
LQRICIVSPQWQNGKLSPGPQLEQLCCRLGLTALNGV